MLSIKNFKFVKGVKKLHPKFIGPFKILNMTPGNNAAKLALLASYSRIHPVFHVSLLRVFKKSLTSSAEVVPPKPEVEDGVPFYKIEKILSKRERRVKKHTVKEYLVKWQGYDDSHNSWLQAKNFTNDMKDELDKFI
jgi:hypothetical protein